MGIGTGMDTGIGTCADTGNSSVLASTPVLALHGFTGSGADFEWLATDTADLCRWYAPDFPGHGLSEAPPSYLPYTAAATARGIHAALAAVQESESTGAATNNAARKPVLLGYSMGGRMALRYLARYGTGSVSALILIGASAGLAGEAERRERRRSDRALAERIEQEGIDAFIRQWNSLPIIASQSRSPYFGQLQQRRRGNSPTGLANSLRGIGTGAVAPVHGRLAGIDVPCLLLTGALDSKFTAIAQSLTTALPRAQAVTIEQSGHSPHWENPAHCTAAIREWIGQLPPEQF